MVFYIETKLNHLSLMLSNFDNYVHRSDLVIDFVLEVHSLMALRKDNLLKGKKHKNHILYLFMGYNKYHR